jgi:hypothetical protein
MDFKKIVIVHNLIIVMGKDGALIINAYVTKVMDMLIVRKKCVWIIVIKMGNALKDNANVIKDGLE